MDVSVKQICTDNVCPLNSNLLVDVIKWKVLDLIRLIRIFKAKVCLIKSIFNPERNYLMEKMVKVFYNIICI